MKTLVKPAVVPRPALPRPVALPALCLVTALGIVAYWAAFFAGGINQAREDAVYLGFETAFPVADHVLALLLVFTAYWHRRGDDRAALTGIAAGGMLVFLALLDITFNVVQGNYALGNVAMQLESIINLWCIALGPWLAVTLWQAHRAA